MEEVVRAAHLCVDMQKIFAKGGLWETPWMERVLPTIEAIVDRYRERTIFSRFITPLRAEDRPGQWQRCFRREVASRSRYHCEMARQHRRWSPRPSRIGYSPSRTWSFLL